MIDPGIKAKLQGMKGAFERAKQSDRINKDFTDLPDGKYHCRLSLMEIAEAKTSGRLQVCETWIVLDGEHAGEQTMRFAGLDKEENLDWLLKDIKKFGIDLAQFDPSEDLPEFCSTMTELKPEAILTVKTKGEYTNKYIDKVLGMSAEVDPTPSQNGGATAGGTGSHSTQSTTPASTTSSTEAATNSSEEAPVAISDKVEFLDEGGNTLVGLVRALSGENGSRVADVVAGGKVHKVLVDLLIVKERARK